MQHTAFPVKYTVMETWYYVAYCLPCKVHSHGDLVCTCRNVHEAFVILAVSKISLNYRINDDEREVVLTVDESCHFLYCLRTTLV